MQEAAKAVASEKEPPAVSENVEHLLRRMHSRGQKLVSWYLLSCKTLWCSPQKRPKVDEDTKRANNKGQGRKISYPQEMGDLGTPET